MNLESLTDMAEKNIQKRSMSLQDFMTTHLCLFKKDGLSGLGEDYKFTALERLIQDFDPTGVETSFQDESPFCTLTFINGELQHLIEVPGLKINHLKDRIHDFNQIFHKTGPLSHLHHANLSDGVVIEVDKKAQGLVLRVVYINTKPGIFAPTLYLKAQDFSEITLLEETHCYGESGMLHLSECTIEVEAGAQVEHVQITKGSMSSIHHGTTNANVAKDAQYKNIMLNMSGKVNRQNLAINLKAPGAHGESYNLFLTNMHEHSDINTVINHQAPDSSSHQIAKGILDGESKGIFTGKIHIHPQAQRVISGQLNKNILLSKKAHVHSQPQLEIFADDVKCSHGSTTGQLSEDEVFYFQARGIPEDKARTILAHGFGLEIVQKIKNRNVQKIVSDLVLETLKTKFHLGGEHESSQK